MWEGYERSRIEDESKRNIPMEVEWMESIIPIIYCQLNIRTMGIRDRIRLMSIYSGIERIVAHGKGSKQRRGSWFPVCPVCQLPCIIPRKIRIWGDGMENGTCGEVV
jgi:hypothetical protein